MMDEISIYELLPQKVPFVMVDRLVHYDPVITETELVVLPENIFVESGKLSAYGLLENIAQTCAARIGYINRTSGESVKIGVIGAVKGFNVFSLPKCGDKLLTKIEVISEVMSLTMVKANIFCNGLKIADCEMKIAVKE